MNPHSELHMREHGKPDNLNEVHNGDVAGETDSFTGLAEESFPASANHVGQKVHDIFQLKQGYCADLPAIKISDLLRLNSLENASIPSLFSIVNKILDESIEKKSGDLSQRVTSVLRKVVHEIERRTLTQEKKFKNQNNLCKAREEKHQSRLKVLEALATGTTMENEIVMERLRLTKIDKAQIEEKKKLDEQDVVRLRKEKDWCDTQISALKEELDLARKTYEKHCLKLETEAKGNKFELEKNLAQLGCLLTDSRKKLKELEAFSETKSLKWKKKELCYKNFIDFQVGSLQNLRVASESIKQEVLKTQRMYSEEFNHLGSKLKELIKAAENYRMVLAENRKLYNEVQDLKGNIRVYCRVRPFLPGQNGKQMAIEYIGEDGELIVANLSKQGKDSRRLFKFNKVFGPAATQEEVFLDTRPLIRSVLDGYHVCIFAYGQTGSGKTYTMTGPTVSSKEDWGVNYRALNDLFHISQLRKSSITYEVSVQMIEIYNEQLRDLLSSNSSQKRLGIWNTAQPNGLAVPDASLHHVKSTADVLELMNIGLMNRAVGATALNEWSSRSHSVVTVHVRGTDLETGDVLRGSLHLVDLAGSERVDRSEATGDRLREAQHINKSLSALGDVIFALAQKSHYVPYRNSKLTQVLQSSLGGQAKVLMFIQLNPDAGSYSETISTLKFAERVSGVELGAARSNKEGRGIRELMEELASLKDGIVKRDEEIGRLRQTKTSVNGDKCDVSSPRFGPSSPSSPRRHSLGSPQQNRTSSGTKSRVAEKAAPDLDNISEHSDKHSEAGSQQSVEDSRHRKEFFRQSRLAGVVDGGQTSTQEIESKNVSVNGSENCIEDIDLLEGIADSEERLSDISDSGLSMGAETDGSNSIVEYILFPESPAENKIKPSIPTKLPSPQKKQGLNRSRLSSTKTSLRVPPSPRKPNASVSSPIRLVRRWQ